MLANSSVNVLCKVSVRTNVPEMNATPSTMASAVSPSRSLWASRPLIVTFHMSGPQRPDPLQDGVGGGLVEFSYHLAIGQEDDPVRVRGPARVMGHHDNRLAEIGHRAPQEREQVRGGVRVEVAGGLVGEDEVRLVDQRPRARHALLLAAGQLIRAVGQPVADTQLLDQVTKPLRV